MTSILIGCDPEIFVKQAGLFKSAHGLIKGDKKNPQKVPYGAVQVDGMALEFNIDPASSEDEFAMNVTNVFATIRSMVPDYEVVACPVAHFDAEYMRQQPAEALELGCDPDYNAWTNAANVKPNAERPMRTASGHVHVGWTDGEDITDNDHLERCNLVVRQLDFYLGLPSLVYDADIDRRSMYGKAGCCRYKPYGVEYRTLSNAWLTSEKLMKWVFRNAKLGVLSVMGGSNLVEKYGDIQSIINDSDVASAWKIIQAEGIEVCNG
jgi:hypothetical protein